MQKYESASEVERKQHFQKLYDYYIGDRKQIIEWMKETMRTLFTKETLAKVIYVRRNITKKVVNRTSLAYKYPANRYLQEEKADASFQEMLAASDINVKAKQWNRGAKILDTVYVSPMWIDDHIEFQVIPPHLISIEENPDNYLQSIKVMYEVILDGKTVKEIWTADEHYFLDSSNKRIAPKDNSGMVNPYGILHFIPCRLRETENHWGEGDTELVDVCERGSILLTSTYHNAIMQSHGIPVGVNLGIQKGTKLPMTPDSMIKVEGIKKDDTMPSLTFAQPQPAIEASLLLVDEMFKTVAIDRGLTADSVSKDTTAQSGAAKEIDTIELYEQREDDIEALRLFEKNLFVAAIAVYNYHTTQAKIAENSTFIIDFTESDQPGPRSVDDEIKEKDFGYKHGLWTPLDDLIDEDEGIDEKEALVIIEENFRRKGLIEAMGGNAVPEPEDGPEEKDEPEPITEPVTQESE
jgi:uncharacterized protein YqgQ